MTQNHLVALQMQMNEKLEKMLALTSVRAVNIKGRAWYLAQDVRAALHLPREGGNDVLQTLSRDQVRLVIGSAIPWIVANPKRDTGVLFLSRAAVYKLIMLHCDEEAFGALLRLASLAMTGAGKWSMASDRGRPAQISEEELVEHFVDELCRRIDLQGETEAPPYPDDEGISWEIDDQRSPKQPSSRAVYH